MNKRNIVRIIAPIFTGFFIILNIYSGETNGWNSWNIMAFIGFIPLNLFYTYRFITTYKKIELDPTFDLIDKDKKDFWKKK